MYIYVKAQIEIQDEKIFDTGIPQYIPMVLYFLKETIDWYLFVFNSYYKFINCYSKTCNCTIEPMNVLYRWSDQSSKCFCDSVFTTTARPGSVPDADQRDQRSLLHFCHDQVCAWKSSLFFFFFHSFPYLSCSFFSSFLFTISFLYWLKRFYLCLQ